jgi:hypothetical protein
MYNAELGQTNSKTLLTRSNCPSLIRVSSMPWVNQNVTQLAYPDRSIKAKHMGIHDVQLDIYQG